MILLAISLLFSLVVILFFPFSYAVLLITIATTIIGLCCIIYLFKPYRQTAILITIGIALAALLAIPKLNAYQTAFNQLPQTGTYQFTLNKIYTDSKAAEIIITSPNSLKGYAVQLYNLPPTQDLKLYGTYQTELTIQPNRAKATFAKLHPRLIHLVNQRIGTANLKSPLILIQPPNSIATLRTDIADYFKKHHFKNSDLMSALSVGLTQGLSQKIWEILRQTGTIHLVAISGLHLTFVALWCFIILKTLLGFCRLEKPSPYRVAAIISILFAFGYAILAGMSLPTQRALIMFAIFMMALFMRYPILNFQSLATALFIILIISPFSIVTIGFWLSFTAVLILMLLSQYRLSFVISLLLTQVIISTLAIPIVASFFNEVSLISPAANLFAIPWATLLVLPPLLLGMLLLPLNTTFGTVLLDFSDHNLTTLMNFLKVMNRVPYGHITVPYIPLLTAILITVLALLLLTKIRPRFKLIYSFGIVIAMIATFKPNQEEYLLALPVGEGLSVLLKSQDQTLLFDTGPYYRGFDSAENTILPTLRNLNIQTLDHIVLSHNNQQHIGGTKTMRRAFPEAKMVMHPSLQTMVDGSIQCQDYHFHSDHLSIEPLPTQKSCGFKISLHDQVIWLLANITPSEWLKLIHQQEKPNIVLFPNKGRSSGYKFPKDWMDVQLIGSTKKIHQNNQPHIIHNAYYGAIKISITNQAAQIKSARDADNFWWVD